MREIFPLLGDEYVQAISVTTSEQPRAAKELGDELGAARSTVYDRTKEMLDHLVVDVEDGRLVTIEMVVILYSLYGQIPTDEQ